MNLFTTLTQIVGVGTVAYVLERRLSPLRVAQAIGEWRTRKVNAMLTMVGKPIPKGGQMPVMVGDAVPTAEMSQPELTTELSPNLVAG